MIVKVDGRLQAMRRSEFVLGRRLTRARLAETGRAVVSVYAYNGRLRYTDPVLDTTRAGKGVLYRIRVQLREGRA